MTKNNAATKTRFDRLRAAIGIAFICAGVAAIIILGAMHGYGHNTIWIAGFLLIISGIFIAKSVELAKAISEWLR